MVTPRYSVSLRVRCWSASPLNTKTAIRKTKKPALKTYQLIDRKWTVEHPVPRDERIPYVWNLSAWLGAHARQPAGHSRGRIHVCPLWPDRAAIGFGCRLLRFDADRRHHSLSRRTSASQLRHRCGHHRVVARWLWGSGGFGLGTHSQISRNNLPQSDGISVDGTDRDGDSAPCSGRPSSGDRPEFATPPRNAGRASCHSHRRPDSPDHLPAQAR